MCINETEEACTRPVWSATDRSQVLKEVDIRPHSLFRNDLQLITPCKGKWFFSNEDTQGIQNAKIFLKAPPCSATKSSMVHCLIMFSWDFSLKVFCIFFYKVRSWILKEWASVWVSTSICFFCFFLCLLFFWLIFPVVIFVLYYFILFLFFRCLSFF